MNHDHPVAEAFREQLLDFIVCIAARPAGCEGEWEVKGTGCLIGWAERQQGPRQVFIATAAHVVPGDEHDHTEWAVVRMKSESHPERAAVFQTGSERTHNALISRYGGSFGNKEGSASNDHFTEDIALLVFDNDACEQGFTGEDEHPPRSLTGPVFALPGTVVAWAGFPSFVNQQLARPFICYYQGVVSLFVNRPDQPTLYLVDGHNASGVSGAPLWHWNEQASTGELVGIVASYAAERTKGSGPLFPGFVHATPINGLIEFLRSRFRP